MKKWLRRILTVFFLGILILSLSRILIHQSEIRRSQDANAALQALAGADQVPDGEASSDQKGSAENSEALADPAPIQVDFDALLSEGPDILGWLYCPDSPINYPVVQGKDNAQYLHSLPNGEHSAAGTLFLDFQNTRDFSDLHSVIYGHHMRDYSMFGSLTRFREEAYRADHPTFWLLTPERDWQCTVAAAAVIPVSSALYDFPQTLPDLEAVFEQSEFKPESMPVEDGHYLTLSTCSYEFENARFVLICRMTPCRSHK